MIGDEMRAALKAGEGVAESGVPLVGGAVEAVVGSELAGHLPHALDRVELRRVAREAVEFEPVRVLCQPRLAGVIEPVTGAIVDDEEELAGAVLGGELQEELVEGVSVEDWRKSVGEVGVLKGDGAEDVGRLPRPEGVDPRLVAYPRPGLVESSIEPEACFVFEENEATTGGRFFLRAGRRTLSQTACFSASARTRRLRGRCTEKPIWLSMRGTE